MSRTRTYKKAENNLVRYFNELFKAFCTSVSKGVMKFINGGRKKLTVMVVPHSQKRIVNFQASIFSIIFVSVLLVGILASFFWFTAESVASAKKLASLKEETRKTQASLNVLKNETNASFRFLTPCTRSGIPISKPKKPKSVLKLNSPNQKYKSPVINAPIPFLRERGSDSGSWWGVS